MRMIFVAGARPNFVKIAPLLRAAADYRDIETILVHTGQHYDQAMSESMFHDLEIRQPDFNLDVGSASHAVQTAEVMKRFEPILLERAPDVVVVVGDVNSTIACALTATKLGIKVAHVEAGLRSFDSTMPEEINRVLTDRISDFLFTTEPSAQKNLAKEGVSRRKVFFAGNVMVDSLLCSLEKAAHSDVISRLQLSSGEGYVLVTLHRPVNVDDAAGLGRLFDALNVIAENITVVFPVHPRTRKQIEKFGIQVGSRICLIEPLGYLDFLRLMSKSRMVLTDSGGIQEETTVLRVPCLTLRENTERPITITVGTNRLVGSDPQTIIQHARSILAGDPKKGKIPRLWDGKAAERIIAVLHRELNGNGSAN
jgi:UDP-N-acetylglucosamine 2-epimerase (non-hydrolysing)